MNEGKPWQETSAAYELGVKSERERIIELLEAQVTKLVAESDAESMRMATPLVTHGLATAIALIKGETND